MDDDRGDGFVVPAHAYHHTERFFWFGLISCFSGELMQKIDHLTYSGSSCWMPKTAKSTHAPLTGRPKAPDDPYARISKPACKLFWAGGKVRQAAILLIAIL